MLLFSYILTSALELVMTIQSLKMGNTAFAWSFGFLLFLSMASIPIETSQMGKMVRKEFKSLGLDTAKYDLISNLGRIIVYIFIISQILSYINGLIIAYLIVFITLIMAIWKYFRLGKQQDNE
ncbi:MAG: hypothetical protein GXY91_00225 [Clostridia bacterium]|nr:hypothetical protein [Clostridia bacterium]